MRHASNPLPQPKPWLCEYIHSACEKEWCVSLSCTTCGARDFRQGLAATINANTTQQGRTEQIAEQLKLIGPEECTTQRFADALEMVYSEFSLPLLSGGYPGLSAHLTGSWIGEQLNIFRQRQQESVERWASFNEYNSDSARAARQKARDDAKQQRIAEQASKNKGGRQRRPERFAAWLATRGYVPDNTAAPITPELARSFATAHFEVAGLVLVPGTENPKLAELLAARGATEAVFITAYNPRGRQVPDFANRQLQRAMTETVLGRWAYCRGWGGSADGNWPPEPSLLLCGATLADGQQLAQQYGQAAFLHIHQGHVALVATDASEQELLIQACAKL